ncbi:MAG: UDP-N-acetylmuramoylalanyl-D-glutamyl-2,6-diaminopimelate--D-alanyl-D-alanine ligase [Alphaproteobacteria bacterium]|nr:UDP-N-acetylmuramoylalanyl-D-glutamyl-2,6-diaminopimelate--D-alanyl-D-alanine ligase [Alphaproteobacteria bacterium]
MKTSWTAETVLCAVRGQSLHTQDWTATGVSIDSRTVQKDDLFIAIKGPSLDGHDYVRAAFDAGAVAAIVDHQPQLVPPDAPLLQVEDTFTALQDLGRVGRARATARIVAVTGSVGKTSCKEQLRLMLGAIDETYATQGSLNNHWGVPLSLSRLPPSAKYGVFEIGMNHAGELGPLSREVKPHVALITNIEAVHLEYFLSTEAIADAKAEIFLGMDPGGIAVINRDTPHYARLLAAARTQGLKKVLSFGLDPKSDAHLISQTTDETGTSVEALILGDKISYRLNTPGAHFAFNALGTLLSCAALGADISVCADALSAYQPPSGRGTQRKLQLKEGGSITLIDETFNASPVATHAAINVLGQIKPAPEARRILVLGDMRELGETAAALHAGLAETIFNNRIDLVHCCGPLMAHLHDILPPAMQGKLRTTSSELAPFVADDIHDGDVLLVKGSHSMHMDKIIDALPILSADALPPTQSQRAS